MSKGFDCPQCGAHLNSGISECLYCGEIFNKEQPRVNSPQLQQQYGNNANNRHNMNVQQKVYTKKRSKGRLIFTIIVILLAIFSYKYGNTIINKFSKTNTDVKTDGNCLIKNFGAEEDLNYWEQAFNKTIDDGTFNLGIDTSNALMDKKCFYLKGKSVSGNMKQVITMEKGKSYLLSLLATNQSQLLSLFKDKERKESQKRSSSKLKAKLLFKTKTGEVAKDLNVNITKKWRSSKKIIYVPDNSTSDQVIFTLEFDISTEAIIYVDDIKVEKVIQKK